MKTVFIRYWDPSEVTDWSFDTLSKGEVIVYCFRVVKYDSVEKALNAYANTACTWSTLLDENADVEDFIDNAYDALKNHDYDWLEANFT